MSEAQVAGGVDRLPWLADEPRVPAKIEKKRDLMGWALLAVLLVAAVSFWLGTRAPVGEAPPQPSRAPQATVAHPEWSPAPAPQVEVAPKQEVRSVQLPEVRQAPVAQVRIVPPVRRVTADDEAKQAAPAPAPETTTQPESTSAKASAPAAPKSTEWVAPTPWPPRVTAGAYGRLVQIGAFGSVQQAKAGWRYMVRAYPAVAHLPAVVRPDRNSKGRTFYRFRIGTTSQAHSEVLCQRMERIRLSCAIIGLPWKSKVER
jgi:outer membrane biosynthesis protein TonB